jgi:drug/metabolite transporter (DMT)-like permease
MKDWHDRGHDCPGGPAVAGLTMIALRMALCLLLLAAVQPRLFRAPRRAYAAGAIVGFTFFLGFALQVWGLAYTTPAHSGFFTSLCSAWVPLGAWLWYRARPGLWPLLGLGLGVAGTAALTVTGGDSGGPLAWAGDLLTLVASAFFGAQVLLLDRLGRVVEPAQTSPAFFAATGLGAAVALAVCVAFGPGFASWAEWTAATLALPGQWWRFGFLVVVSTYLAFHWMNTYQPRVPAMRAALVYLLEPVFAALTSVAVGFDRPSWGLAAGGALILAGNLLVEVPNRRKVDNVDSGPQRRHDQVTTAPPGDAPCPNS